MKDILKKQLIVLALAITFPQINAQTILNGFFSEKGEGNVALNYTYKPYSKFYRGSSLQSDNPAGFGRVDSHIVNIYADYAITNWLTGVVTLPYISQNNENNIADPVNGDDTVSDLQDVGVYLKAKALHIKKGKSTFTGAVGAGFSAPLGNYDAGGILSIGSRTTAVSGYLIGQYRHDIGIFVEGQYGYSIRSGASDFDVPDANLWNFKLGYSNKYFYTDVQLGIQNSPDGTDIGSAEFAQQGGPTSFPNNEVDYTNIGVNVYIPIQKSNFGISTSYNAILEGRNVGKYQAYTVGAVYSIKKKKKK